MRTKPLFASVVVVGKEDERCVGDMHCFIIIIIMSREVVHGALIATTLSLVFDYQHQDGWSR